MKRLGFGLMRLPVIGDDKARVDKEKVCRMVDLFIERGFQYFDTAWFYHEKQSELVAGECLVSRYPRESFFLADKMPLDFLTSKDEVESIFTRQLEKCRVGYFDYYLIHALKGGDKLKKAEDYHLFDFLREKKAQGLARHIGFSFHDSAEVLDDVLTRHPEVDFVQLQINYLDWDSGTVQSEKVYETARRHGKDVIIMEPVKGGTLARLPEKALDIFRAADPGRSPSEWAIRFASSLEGVLVVLSGMSTLEQVDENTSFMSNPVPLSDAEKAVVFRAAEVIKDDAMIPCTACRYCVDGCPAAIPIPDYFALYNSDLRKNGIGRKSPDSSLYEEMADGHGKASDCIECGQCESVCPQALEIRKHLRDVASRFEES